MISTSEGNSFALRRLGSTRIGSPRGRLASVPRGRAHRELTWRSARDFWATGALQAGKDPKAWRNPSVTPTGRQPGSFPARDVRGRFRLLVYPARRRETSRRVAREFGGAGEAGSLCASRTGREAFARAPPVRRRTRSRGARRESEESPSRNETDPPETAQVGGLPHRVACARSGGVGQHPRGAARGSGLPAASAQIANALSCRVTL